MCLAYFKMNKFEKNPKKYIMKKCSFLFSRGYSLKTFQKNAEYCFDFYIKDKGNKDINHIYFFYENEYVDCTFSNVNCTESHLKTLNIDYPVAFDVLTDIEKIDFLIDCVRENIQIIDIRPITKP